MLEQKGRIAVVERLFRQTVGLKSALKREIPPPSDDDNLASYFNKLLDVAGVGEEAGLDAVRLTVTSPGRRGVLLADISTIRNSATSPLAMLLVQKEGWTGILTGVAEAKYTVPPDPELEGLKSTYQSETVRGLLNLAGQVVLLPVKAVAGSTSGAIRGGLLGATVATALGAIFFSPLTPVLFLAGAVIGATTQGIRKAANETAEQAKQIPVAAKEVGEKARAVQEINREIEGRRQVAGALGQITKNLCPAANLRGIFQVYHDDNEPVLYVTGYEDNAVIDLRSSEKNNTGIFISGEDMRNSWFFDLVARTTGLRVLFYDPASGMSYLLTPEKERVVLSRGVGHNIPIANIAACVAFYQFSESQKGTRLFEAPRGASHDFAPAGADVVAE